MESTASMAATAQATERAYAAVDRTVMPGADVPAAECEHVFAGLGAATADSGSAVANKREADAGAVLFERIAIAKKPLGYRFVKRAFDIVFSAGVIAVGFVPGLILSAFIVRDTGGGPIYSSIRVGRGGKPFHLYKFRSMVADSDDLEKYLSPEQLDQWHREHKVDGDPRITKLGNFLRETSIDEFPQFVNVLLGQLSTVGCRAITDEEIAYFGSDRDLLLSMRPGITGVWQTGPRNIATFESGIRQELDLSYIANASLKLDAKIILRTFRAMAERTGK